jgi:hypothetical protein
MPKDSTFSMTDGTTYALKAVIGSDGAGGQRLTLYVDGTQRLRDGEAAGAPPFERRHAHLAGMPAPLRSADDSAACG